MLPLRDFMFKEKNKRSLFFLFFTVFLDMLGFGILIPIIPQLFANPASQFYLLSPETSIGFGYILLGFLVAVFPLGQFFSTSIMGQLSDFYGRKKLLIISIGATVIAYVLFALGIWWRNIPLLFISRFFAGITGGNIVVAQAAIADLTIPENRSRNFGMIGAAFGLGFIIGPYIGGKLSDPTFIAGLTPASPFWFAAGLALINTLLIIFYFKETNLSPKREKLNWNKSIANIKRALVLPNLRHLYVTSFLYQAGFSFYTSFFAVYLVYKFSVDQGTIGEFFAFIGLCVVLTQVFIVRRVAKAYKEETILRWSILGSGLAVLSFFMPHQLLFLFALVPFFAVFNGLSLVNLTALISKSADSKEQGEILGINASVSALAQAIPPAISGFVAAIIIPTQPIVVAGVFILVSGVYFVFIFKTLRNKKKETTLTSTVLH